MAAEPPQQSWRPIPDPTELTTEAVALATAQFRREIAALREIIETRLAAMDTATALLSETVNRTPTVIQTEISHLRELTEARIGAHDQLSQSWREAIEQRFSALDSRMAQQQATNRDALDTALRSARELGDLQTKANTLANSKTEQSVDQQLRALSEKVDLNAQRIDRGEASTSGAAGSREERRLDTAGLLQVLGLLVVAAGVLFAIIHG